MKPVKGSCHRCGGHFSFDPNDAGSEVVCPHCKNITKLLTPSMASKQVFAVKTPQGASPTPVKKAQTKSLIARMSAYVRQNWSNPVSSGEHPLEHLGRVRRSTCYPVMRTFLRIVLALSLVSAAVFGLIALYIAVGYLSSQFVLADALKGFGLMTAITILSLLHGIVIYEGGSLLIDIADVLIDQNRNKNP